MRIKSQIAALRIGSLAGLTRRHYKTLGLQMSYSGHTLISLLDLLGFDHDVQAWFTYVCVRVHIARRTAHLFYWDAPSAGNAKKEAPKLFF